MRAVKMCIRDRFGDTTWFTYRYELNGMVYETSAGSLDICRTARDKWMKRMSVAFTGHRTTRTDRYALSVSLNEEVLELAFSEQSLEVQRAVVMEEFKQRCLNQPYGDRCV